MNSVFNFFTVKFGFKKKFFFEGVIVMSLLNFLGIQRSAGSELKIGDSAPTLEGKKETGETVKLKDFTQKGMVLVYFYPKADTPGCTAQACSLRDSYAVLQDKGVTIFGVSTDSVESQKKFKEKYRLPFALIADTEKTWAKGFGVSTTFGFTSRQAFLIRDDKIVWLDRSASTKEQAQDVLKFLEK